MKPNGEQSNNSVYCLECILLPEHLWPDLAWQGTSRKADVSHYYLYTTSYNQYGHYPIYAFNQTDRSSSITTPHSIEDLRSTVTLIVIVKVSLSYWKGVLERMPWMIVLDKIAWTVDTYFMRNLALRHCFARAGHILSITLSTCLGTKHHVSNFLTCNH